MKRKREVFWGKEAYEKKAKTYELLLNFHSLVDCFLCDKGFSTKSAIFSFDFFIQKISSFALSSTRSFRSSFVSTPKSTYFICSLNGKLYYEIVETH